MARPEAQEPPPHYDWLAELGEVAFIKRPGLTRSTHPLSRAILVGGAAKKRALVVIEKALRLAEGRVPVLAAIFDCHYLTAFRLMNDAGLGELAGQLRFENHHPGPTGLGIQARKPKARAK